MGINGGKQSETVRNTRFIPTRKCQKLHYNPVGFENRRSPPVSISELSGSIIPVSGTVRVLNGEHSSPHDSITVNNGEIRRP